MKQIEYNKKADKYKKMMSDKNREMMKFYSQNPTVFKHLGSVLGKSIFDIGCGHGYYTEKIYKLKPKEVFGIDVSKEMIKIAKQNNKTIDYQVCDAKKLSFFKEFDIALAIHVLHYAKTKKELQQMCDGAYKNLKRGGKFIAMIMNPDYDFSRNKYSEKYLTIYEKDKLPLDGEMNRAILFGGKKNIYLDTVYFSRQVYKEVLENAGFKKIRFCKPIIVKEGIKEMGVNFWQERIKNPTTIIVECFK
ncbi:class I SAM-dependent methyltransferase [Patescibacteria group bacterium]|nr:class I SAM-dependent methyltransferase [Patescibacteria group bacterium]